MENLHYTRILNLKSLAVLPVKIGVSYAMSLTA